MKALPFRYPDKPIDTTPGVVAELSYPDWIAQTKYDGWRMPVFIDSANTIRCLSRVGNPLADKTRLIPSLEDHLIRLGLPDGTVLDTEFVGPRGSLPPSIYLFDCLAWDGQWLCSEPYSSRWQRCLNLAPIINEQMPIRLATTVFEDMTGTDISEVTRLAVKMPSMDFMHLFECLKIEWMEAGKPKKWLYDGIVVKRCAGKLLLDRNSNKKSQHMFKLRFREIGEQRY